MRINEEIRAKTLRVITGTGEQVGIISLEEALAKAEEAGLDLVEIVPTANPPVAKIIDFGKFRYDQTKREKESKKAQVQIKVKEVKVKPNIDKHDLEVKVKRARQFIEKGNKVKISCMFRGREITHPEVGKKVVEDFLEEVADIAAVESPVKMLGRNLIVILAPLGKKGKVAS